MALSSSAGAEVQTLSDSSYWWTLQLLLTMVVLPVLFKVLMEKNLKT
jgi:hypothetical protein